MQRLIEIGWLLIGSVLVVVGFGFLALFAISWLSVGLLILLDAARLVKAIARHYLLRLARQPTDRP